MKKVIIILSTLLFIVVIAYACYVALLASVIDNPTTETCLIETKTIVSITEGISHDIIFSDAMGNHYYINRGLERGLNLDSLNAKVLNKTVTLHLAKVLGGFVTSEHISQISIGEDIIYTEFN